MITMSVSLTNSDDNIRHISAIKRGDVFQFVDKLGISVHGIGPKLVIHNDYTDYAELSPQIDVTFVCLLTGEIKLYHAYPERAVKILSSACV